MTDPIALRALPHASEVTRTLEPDAETRAEIARELGLSELRKVRAEARLTPEGKRDWRLALRYGATVVQPCGVTLAPVVTRIEETVERRYLAHWRDPEGDEVEMPEDDAAGPIPETLDLIEVLSEAIALAAPDYPRAEGVELGAAVFAEPGVRPMTDDDARPFAGLAGLRDKLEEGGDS